MLKHLLLKKHFQECRGKMARSLYSALLYLFLPMIMARLGYRAIRSFAYSQRVAERFGYFSTPDFVASADFSGAIWVHCVSVGETVAASPLIQRLHQQYPGIPLVVTTMTPTGSERVKATFADTVFHVYAPYDFPGSVKRFLNRVKPKWLIIMETELWPNTLYYCHQKKIPILLANARLSEKSANGYRRLSALSLPMLQHLTVVAAQSQEDANRFIGLGLPAQRVDITGSIKFDIRLEPSLKQQALLLKARWSDNNKRLIVIAASTHESEDVSVLQAFKKVLVSHPYILLVLVPRHPERFNKVAALCRQMQLKMQYRSDMESLNTATQVVVGNTMGELLLLYGCADIAFVGGSLVERGGHNTIEAAAWGLPIVTGDSDFNFSEISRLLQLAGAIKKVSNSQLLAQYIITMADDVTLRHSAGEAALSVVESNRGALDRLFCLLNKLPSD